MTGPGEGEVLAGDFPSAPAAVTPLIRALLGGGTPLCRHGLLNRPVLMADAVKTTFAASAAD